MSSHNGYDGDRFPVLSAKLNSHISHWKHQRWPQTLCEAFLTFGDLDGKSRSPSPLQISYMLTAHSEQLKSLRCSLLISFPGSVKKPTWHYSPEQKKAQRDSSDKIRAVCSMCSYLDLNDPEQLYNLLTYIFAQISPTSASVLGFKPSMTCGQASPYIHKVRTSKLKDISKTSVHFHQDQSGAGVELRIPQRDARSHLLEWSHARSGKRHMVICKWYRNYICKSIFLNKKKTKKKRKEKVDQPTTQRLTVWLQDNVGAFVLACDYEGMLMKF